MFNLTEVRREFPILGRRVDGRPLVYLDNAATTQMPESVLSVMTEQYRSYEANVHRGIHYLSEKSTQRMEKARATIAKFLNARSSSDIIFTSGTTSAINMAAACLSDKFLNPGDEILVTAMEHHSNLVPWQQAAARTGAVLKVLQFDGQGNLRTDVLDKYITEKTKIAAFCAVSNVIGTVNPIHRIISRAHEAGAYTLVDAAQAVRHMKIDVTALDCDFLAFSGHKIMGPTGTGVLYGKQNILEALPPVQFGGGMVDTVFQNEAVFGEPPFRFEAGTPNIAGNIALGAAVEHFTALRDDAAKHEKSLIEYTEKCMSEIPEIKIIGAPFERCGVISFNIDGMQCYDAASLLDKLGIAVRSGHHCAQPALRFYGLSGAVRVSPAYYNTFEEIDIFIAGLKKVISLANHIAVCR